MRTVLLTFGLLFLLLSLLVQAAAPAHSARASAPPIPLYAVEYLGVLPGADSSVAYGVNDLGAVVGYSGYPEQAFVWHESTGMVRLVPIPGYTRCHARDINNVGEVAGTCGWDVTDEPSRATRWLADGTPQNLGTLGGGRFSEGHALNDRGNLVGASSIGAGTLTYHAFIYTDEGGLLDITPEADGAVRGYDINNVGPIGEATGSASAAFRWRNGTLEWLPPVADFGYAFAFAINDNSQVAGTAHSSSGNSEKAVRWTDGTGWEVLGGVGQNNKSWGINDAGTVVGRGRPFAGAERAFIYTDESGMQDLNNYLTTPGWFISTAHDMNDAGIIVGYGSHASGIYGAVRLVPVQGEPTPTATPTATGAPPTLPATATGVPTALPATATGVPPTLPATATSAPPTPTATGTRVPPTVPATATVVPSSPTATATGVPPTRTASATSAPPTLTATTPAAPPIWTATATSAPPTRTVSPTALTTTPTATPMAPLQRLYLPLVWHGDEGS